MTLIVAARFSTFDAANAAALRLMEAGVHEDALHVFYVNPPGAHDIYTLGGDQAVDPDTRGAPRKALGTAAVLGAAGAVAGGLIIASFSDSFIPIVAGAGVGAYVGSLAGAMRGMDKRRDRVQDPHGPRQAVPRWSAPRVVGAEENGKISTRFSLPCHRWPARRVEWARQGSFGFSKYAIAGRNPLSARQ